MSPGEIQTIGTIFAGGFSAVNTAVVTLMFFRQSSHERDMRDMRKDVKTIAESVHETDKRVVRLETVAER